MVTVDPCHLHGFDSVDIYEGAWLDSEEDAYWEVLPSGTMREWCLDNGVEVFHWFVRWEGMSGGISQAQALIADPDQALLFKLTWGGE